jgi:60 kDa SS-A/Ro ribonucleoprotein
MNSNYRRHFSSRETRQDQPIPGEKMVQNNAGGFTFQVGRWDQLARFLILGSEGGSYYVGERELTVENAQNVLACIQEDGQRTINTIVEISDQGRAPKNDPALFALAMCAGMGDEATRKRAFEALPKVARIGTHLLHFANFMEGFRGWGRAARRGVGNWFLDIPVERLGYQFLKYAQRDGWALRDLLRLAHPQTEDPSRNALFKYIVSGEVTGDVELPPQVFVASTLNEESSLQEVIDGITRFSLPREAIPNKFLNEVEVWEALLQSMPMTAMIRNLGKMTQVGLLKPLSDSSKLVAARLQDSGNLERARIHPINVLAALITYQGGRGFRGKLSWKPVPHVVDALDAAFYKSFKFVEPTGKNILIGLDVSGSMTMGGVNGMPFLNPRVASAALCMTTARTEANWHIMGFTDSFVEVPVSPRQRLDDVVRTTNHLPFGRTDCSLPMLWASENGVAVDAFVIYTDNETWHGRIHPVQALQQYRERTGIPAKLIVNAMTATEFTIAKRSDRGYGTLYQGQPQSVTDPDDGGMLDVAGLDSAAPKVMSDFIRD